MSMHWVWLRYPLLASYSFLSYSVSMQSFNFSLFLNVVVNFFLREEHQLRVHVVVSQVEIYFRNAFVNGGFSQCYGMECCETDFGAVLPQFVVVFPFLGLFSFQALVERVLQLKLLSVLQGYFIAILTLNSWRRVHGSEFGINFGGKLVRYAPVQTVVTQILSDCSK